MLRGCLLLSGVSLAVLQASAASGCQPVPSLAQPAQGPQRTEKLFVWPGLAPGETSDSEGVDQPRRPQENPPVTRVTGIRRPTIDVYPAREPNGTAILVLPGGGFARVVPDKEGSEAAPWLDELGITTFVLRYRTNESTPAGEAAWERPLQDAQRALRLIRAQADRWQIDPHRVGVLGFSAGGQVAAILHTATEAHYPPRDKVDEQSATPDFSLLIYPWRVLRDDQTLLPQIRVTDRTPPAFLVHTHDDRSSSVGAVLIYAALRQHNRPAELHVYANGGHGYGMRPVAGSEIGTWPDRATAWLRWRKLANTSK